MKHKIFFLFLSLLIPSIYCQAQGQWKREYATDDWGNPTTPIISSGPLFLIATEKYSGENITMHFQMTAYRAYVHFTSDSFFGNTNFRNYENFRFSIKMPSQEVVDVPLSDIRGDFNSNSCLLEGDAYLFLVGLLSSRPFKVLLTGSKTDILGYSSAFNILFEVPNMTSSFMPAYTWMLQNEKNRMQP